MPRIAVVFVSYLKVPESRLQDHFAWNDAVYRAFGDQLRVYVVSDVEHDMPDYAETVLFPIERLPVVNGQPRFSLSMTKNAGIQKAIGDGCTHIVCTDVDISFDCESLGLCAAVDNRTASIPIYRMAQSFTTRDTGREDRGCTGTIGMTDANWRRWVLSCERDFCSCWRDIFAMRAAFILVSKRARILFFPSS